MNTGTALLLLASLPILTVVLIEPLATSEPPAQGDTQAMSARDLYAERADPPPGLKCRVLMLDAAGDAAAIRPDAVFHSHDHIRLEFESNVPGYLYLLQRGSDTTWNVLFPSAELRDSNRLQAGRPVEFPRDADFYFDETPGQERIYAVLALKPEPDLERLLNLVRNGQTAGGGDGRLAELFQQISNAVSAELRSRNLRVSTESAGGAQSATYAVNTAQGQARVILELVLKHER